MNYEDCFHPQSLEKVIVALGAQPVEFARRLRRELTAAGVEIKACGT